MKRRSKRETPEIFSPARPDLADLISKMQQQLISLERKIDTLISQPSQRPFEGKHFSKPFQHFDRSARHGEGNQGGGFRERKLFKVICAECNKECEVPFRPSGDRPVYCKECFSKRKGDGSSRGFTQERHFDKKQSDENQGFDQKKKPRRKKRN